VKAGAHRAVGQLDLESVALRAHAVEVDLFEHLAAKALEAAVRSLTFKPSTIRA